MKFSTYYTLLSLASTFSLSLATVVDTTKNTNYDFIVIGGGTAGNVIANRLTEDPNINVLVLEAGVSNENVQNVIVPFFCTSATPNTPYDWNYTTAPQTALNGRTFPYPRGFILGGSSSVNYMAYTRGSSEDYDRFAKLSGDSGWSWNSVQPYIRKNEKFSPPADHHNTTGQFNPAVHSTTGINAVSLPGFLQSIDNRVIQTTQQLPHEFPFNIDTNSGNHIGIAWQQATILDGARSSSATSYLGPKFVSRPNLHVMLHAQVTRLLQTSSKPLSLRTVEYVTSIGGPRLTITASKEVILSAGAVGTPQILMNSGVGDSKALSSLGIKTLVNNPSVGQNLSDHALINVAWSVTGNDTFETAERDPTLAAAQLAQWQKSRTGVLVTPTFTQMGWLRIPSNSSIFKTAADPAAGPNTAHYEFVFENGLGAAPPPTGNFLSILIIVVSPASRGSVTLKSSNPFDHPVINPNVLTSPFDMAVMREGIRSARRFVQAPAWKDYIIAPLSNATTDAELDEMIRTQGGVVFHPVGTASMSPKGAKYGVVDPDLRVKGVSGLRIVDASVIPRVPAAHTQAPVYIFAERAADLIKSAWRIKSH